MPLTLSGRRVALDTTEHPSLVDIAVALSRMPRFAGHTNRWFSVLDHTMFGYGIIMGEGRPGVGPLFGPIVQRAWLLHDAHEALTGDVPTDIKGDDLRRTQEELDRRIYAAFMPTRDMRKDHVMYDTA